MKVAERLALRYPNPGTLGLHTTEQVADLIKSLARDVDSEDDTLIHGNVLYQLLDLEITILAQQVEQFRADGQMSVTQGLEVRLKHLKSERIAAGKASGLVTTVRRGGVISVPTIARW